MSAFRKTTETFTVGARTLPQQYFTGQEIFAQEKAKIFSRQWILVGHQSEIARAGDFLVVTVVGESLIVLRDQRLTVRAFYNVCRHRGTRLCEAASGRLRVIQCPYHAWTYALDGRLTGAPHMDEVPDFEKSDYSLHAAHLALWEGFIFVNLAAEPMPAAEWFVPLAEKFAHWNLPRLRSVRRIEYDVQANWKLIFQNY